MANFFYKRSGDRQRDTVDYIDFVYLTTTKMYCSSTKVALNNMQVANIYIGSRLDLVFGLLHGNLQYIK